MDDEQKKRDAEERALEHEEIHNEDFQAVLKTLLAAYQPILEEDLRRAQAQEELKKEAESNLPSCDDELKLADRFFSAFFTEDAAMRMLPPQARELLGPIDRWRWCLLHVRCCMTFGWLVSRGPRTYRSFVYYLYRYWLCVRQALGTPVASPPTQEQRTDFETLVQALKGAFQPFLADQLAGMESIGEVSEAVLAGKLTCTEGEDDAAAVFERFLSVETAPALLGRAAFDAHSKEPWFWFCRCWCLCAIRFGACLAKAKNLIDVLWCLLYFFRCLRDCFRPLACEVTSPSDCVEEQAFPLAGILRGVEIKGTATGAFCSHYTLQWRQDGVGPWQSTGIHYPGGAAQGACGVVNGVLGYLETFPFVPPGPVQIQLCVFSTQGGAPVCCSIQFELSRNLVWIQGIEGIDAADYFNPLSQLVDGTGTVRSFGTSLQVFGSASVGGCVGKAIKRYTLSYQPGFTTTLAGAWTQFWQVDYLTALQLDAGSNLVFNSELTKLWREFHFPPGLCLPVFDYLQGTYWSTQVPQAFPVTPSEPPCPAPVSWASVPLQLPNCQSGRYTLRLTVEDTGGGVKDNLRQVWFDNKDIYGKIKQIAGVDPCAIINLSTFAASGGVCSVAWPANLLGIAYDEYIEEGNFAAPSDNFEGYQLWIKKDGGAWFPIPIPGPSGPPWGPPFVGTNRVGDPGVRCPTAVPPPGPIPPETPGILSVLDMRRLDATCNPGEPGLTLKRGKHLPNGGVQPGECCGYVMWLQVRDKTICPSLAGGRHQVDDPFPFYICNDLFEPGP